MVNPVTNAGAPLSPVSSQESTMGRDDFLKLLVAQLKNQDPLSPMQNTEFVTQLAQFSSLEQAVGMNARLDLLAIQSRGQSNTDAVGFIGKHVAVVGSNVTLDSSGTGASVAFQLGGNAEETRVVVRDANGRTVRTLDLGARQAGLVSTRWDGNDNLGVRQPPGNYSVTVEAKTAEGGAVYVMQQTTGTVTKVSFDQGYAVLTLDSGLSVPISDLLEVTAK
jgi:flagellar basal-body rod modification protein FlgD